MSKRVIAGVFAALMIVGAGWLSDLHSLRAEYVGQATFAVAASGGSANAQTVNLGAGNVTSMSDLKGVTISWIVGSGLTNTGPAQINVNGQGLVNIYRRNGGSLIALGGGEMPAGDLVRATYDGAQFELETDYTGGEPVGTSKIANYSTADPGYALEYGQCVSKTTYAPLYAKIADTWTSADSCGTGNFGLPDMRGRAAFGLDNMGGTAANRITSTVSGITGTTLGAVGGSQGYSAGIDQTYLKSFTLPASTTVGSNLVVATSSTNFDVAGACCVPGATVHALNNSDFSATVTSGGSGTAFPTIGPAQIVAYEIKL